MENFIFFVQLIGQAILTTNVRSIYVVRWLILGVL